MDQCEYHVKLVSDIAVIKTNLDYIKNKVCSHVEDGEKDGGYRDRLLIVEREVSALKKAEWSRVLVAGLVGGLIGNLTPDIFGFLIRVVFAGK